MLKSISGGALALALALVHDASAAQKTRCERVLDRFGDRLADATCVESPDLTTNNPNTTPQNNSIAGLPAFAFTPQTDRGVISPDALNKTPITRAVPGVQINARIASDPQGQARFLLRLPDDWNGRLVVAGASGTRSEFNGDFAWSDYVIQKGYAYASQNKGVLNLKLSTSSDPLACRLNPSTPVYVHFYDNDPGQQFTRWAEFMAEAARLARRGLQAHYGSGPDRTYAVGTSNGGYQVRRAVESFPELFDGGVDWEGTYVDAENPNILTDLPPAILNFPDYVASGFNPNSTAAKNLLGAGYPPDVLNGASSMWLNYSNSFWEVTQCQWQKRLDPGYDTYGSGTGTYNYVARRSQSDVAAQLAAFATTGAIRRPLITVAGTMDALLPIDHHARAYARRVAAAQARGDDGDGDGDDRRPAYRLYEVQNGNHIETYKSPPQIAVPPPGTFPQLEFIQPHAQRAFDLLVQSVEHRASLPPSQCIPHGGSISAAPAQPGHCASQFVP
ncbi:MAG TPA: tannase/feruloyl esterase family alpha/beta hydrolase [Myxococcales bacterium]|nr:tannase/feruloyl esterase family alpha/beta hydrolase [Myxococcales bacterium]